MLNPYDFAYRKIKKIVNYDATEAEKLDLIEKSLGILSTKVEGKDWFYSHPSFNDKFYSDFGTTKKNKGINFKNPWVLFFYSLLSVYSIEEVKKEIYLLEKSNNYRDWLVENVRKPRIIS